MTDKSKRLFGVYLRAGFGIILVILLIWNVSTEKLMRSLLRVSFLYFLLAVGYQYISVLIGSMNQYILFRTFKNLKYKTFLFSFFRAFAIGLLLPGRFGDASISFFLKSEGLYYSQAFSAYLWDKYLTFTLYLAIVLIFVGNILGQQYYVPLALWIFLGVIFPIILYNILRRAGRWQVAKTQGRFFRFSENLLTQLLEFVRHHPLLLLINLAFTFVKLGLVIYSYHAMLGSLGYALAVWDVGLASLASGIFAYIPISIQGLGTVETAAVFNFKTLGVLPADVLVCYLLLRTNTYALATVAYLVTFFVGRQTQAK
jgi:hypothetical protein